MPTLDEQETKRQAVCSFDAWYRGKAHAIGVGDGYVAGYLAGAAAERERVLAIATGLPRLQIEGCWHIDLDELERRIKEQE